MEKKTVVLDLDQTLISAEDAVTFNFKKYKEKTKKFRSHNMDDYYIIFERPYLQEFLTFLFDNFNVCVWTAATKDYALFIIENIVLASKQNRKLDYILFNYHCNISENQTDNTKNLNMFYKHNKKYKKSNTLILDDYDEVYNTQPSNCIIAEEFRFKNSGSENDTFLRDIIPFMKEINKRNDSGASFVNSNMKSLALAKKKAKPIRKSPSKAHVEEISQKTTKLIKKLKS